MGTGPAGPDKRNIDLNRGNRSMEYDDIIVGAGSSGAVLAARLSEDRNRSVLLLEAGPDYPAVEQSPDDLLRTWISAGPHDWGLVAKATPDREIAYPRGKVTGGSSAVTCAGMAMRNANTSQNDARMTGSFSMNRPYCTSARHCLAR